MPNRKPKFLVVGKAHMEWARGVTEEAHTYTDYPLRYSVVFLQYDCGVIEHRINGQIRKTEVALHSVMVMN